MSMGKYVSLKSQGDESLTAIPVFPSRVFRQSSLYVRADSSLKSAEELTGKKIGIPEWRRPPRSTRAAGSPSGRGPARGDRVDPGRGQPAGPRRKGRAAPSGRHSLPSGTGAQSQRDVACRRHRCRDERPSSRSVLRTAAARSSGFTPTTARSRKTISARPGFSRSCT